MKKFLLALITLFLLMGFSIPAYAAESGDDPIVDQPNQQEQDKEPLVVATFEELQAAIDAAEYGDVIYLSTVIHITEKTLETDKKLTIASGNEENCALLYLDDGAKISGFAFSGDKITDCNALIVVNYATNNGVIISNCKFDYRGNDYFTFIKICGDININKVYIDHCAFSGATGRAITMTAYTDVQIDSCNFEGNHSNSAGGAINSSGKLQISNSTFTDNSSSAINSFDDLLIKNCQFSENFIAHNGEKDDISSAGKITIINDLDDLKNYYNEITGEKVEMPLTNYEGIMRLIYLTEEQAADYFTPEQPEEPGNQTEDDDTTDGKQPPEGEGADNPDNGDQDDSRNPAQPPQDGSEDNTTDTTPDTPQEPADSNNSNNDNYTPPTDYRPSQRPLWPIVTVKPTENNKPQTQPDNNPSSEKTQLVCNGAVIDTSRTVVLLGYGDGFTHKNDPLTRAQMATVIYRLLDDDSIALFSSTQLAFTDVAAEAWYAPYIRVIQAAGIVNGVGGGLYDPEGLLTWGQTLTILSRFVEPQEYILQHIKYSGWAEQATKTAVALGWIEDRTDFIPDAIISRGELEQLINSVLVLYR